MEAKQQADLMIAEFSLAVLASMGHEINMDKVTLIAKSTAALSVDKTIATITAVTLTCTAPVLWAHGYLKKPTDKPHKINADGHEGR